eukprot:scaffold46988_cov58-Phaeocystis_antarctica.AAC.3
MTHFVSRSPRHAVASSGLQSSTSRKKVARACCSTACAARCTFSSASAGSNSIRASGFLRRSCAIVTSLMPSSSITRCTVSLAIASCTSRATSTWTCAPSCVDLPLLFADADIAPIATEARPAAPRCLDFKG